ncbi:hypothetical protein [Poriferisphaera sp. WC338]
MIRFGPWVCAVADVAQKFNRYIIFGIMRDGKVRMSDWWQDGNVHA